MPSRARDRQLAKHAERRRQAEASASKRRRDGAARGVGGGVVVDRADRRSATSVLAGDEPSSRPTPERRQRDPVGLTAPATGEPQQTGTVTPRPRRRQKVACGGSVRLPPTSPSPSSTSAPSPEAGAGGGVDLHRGDRDVVRHRRGSTLDSRARRRRWRASCSSRSRLLRRAVLPPDRPVDRRDPGRRPARRREAAGPGYSIADELTGKETYAPGTLAMANGGPDTGGSQFFLITEPNGRRTWTTSEHTIFGDVTDGDGRRQEDRRDADPRTRRATTDAPIEAVYIDRSRSRRRRRRAPRRAHRADPARAARRGARRSRR